MKKALIAVLKVAVPLGIGVWLVFYNFNSLTATQRSELFTAIQQADLRWLWLGLGVGWLAHLSRAWRWRYLLEPIGYRPGFWNCYHAVMIGYFMNMFIQRVGEASRAASLFRSEKVPFEKGFGTVLAERVVDVVMLMAIAAITILFQLDKLDLLNARLTAFRAQQGAQTDGTSHWGRWVMIGIAVLIVFGVWSIWSRPALRERLRKLFVGFVDGLRTVFRTKSKWAFIAHTILIWAAYLAMFKIGFYCMPSMAEVPFAGILGGFIAGAIGIALVQGGIGVYPAFVALIIGVYMPAADGGSLIRPDALAMGWLLWLSQTLMLIVLGGVSLLLTALKKPVA